MKSKLAISLVLSAIITPTLIYLFKLGADNPSKTGEILAYLLLSVIVGILYAGITCYIYDLLLSIERNRKL